MESSMLRKQMPVTALADPANRLRVGHPSGYIGAAFIVSGLLVWGFTAGILSALLDRGGWARPWDTTRVLDLDEAWRFTVTGGAITAVSAYWCQQQLYRRLAVKRFDQIAIV